MTRGWRSLDQGSGLEQSGGNVRAVGRPMPGGARLPRVRRSRSREHGLRDVGLGLCANQMMPRFPQAKRAHVAASSPAIRQAAHGGDAMACGGCALFLCDFDRIAPTRRRGGLIVLPSGLHAEYACAPCGRQACAVETDGASSAEASG